MLSYYVSLRYDFRIKTMFGSSLPPILYRTRVLFTLFVSVEVQIVVLLFNTLYQQALITLNVDNLLIANSSKYI